MSEPQPIVEIKITEEMLEAGFVALMASRIMDDPQESDKLALAEVFRAMLAAAPQEGF